MVTRDQTKGEGSVREDARATGAVRSLVVLKARQLLQQFMSQWQRKSLTNLELETFTQWIHLNIYIKS